ncbi:hypothetical protein [Nocardia lasii]|uniref:Uncharacterized protein n=1 Tax=Nocardia lasii TaxID=1616107 RepID=A0ABW1JS34_9NOCA
MGEIDGFAIPADRNPKGLPADLVFPWEQAAFVVNRSPYYKVENMDAVMRNIVLSLGDPNAVTAVMNGWNSAVSSLAKAVDGSGGQIGLETANERLAARWVGAAADSATAYVGRLVTATRTEKAAILKMHGKINELGAIVTSGYITNIAHVHNYAARLKDAEGVEYDIRVQSLRPDWSSTSMFALGKKLLGEFIDITEEVKEGIRSKLNDMEGQVNLIAGEIAAVEIPGGIDDTTVKDVESWQPRNPTGPPWGTPS